MEKEAETQDSFQALQASETRYRRLFETAKDGILILNAETGEIDDVNPYMIDMLHYSYEEFMGMKLWEVSPFKDTVLNKDSFEELQNKGYIRYKDLPLETKEGKPIAVEFVSNVYKANGNKVIQCNIRNITERKQSQQALLESEERFRRVTESLQEAVWSSDLTGKFDFLSPIMTGIYGRPLSEMIGCPDFWIDASHPEDQALVRASKEALFRDCRVELDYRIILPDGTVRWIYDRKLLLRNEHGEPSRIAGIVSDITDRKKAEEALWLKNLVFDASIAANSIADLSGNITEANNAFFQMWGYPGRDEVFGKPISHFLNNPGEAAAIVTALNENGKWEGDYTAEKNDGSTFIAHGLATVVRDNKGKAIGYQASVIDITERKQAEEALVFNNIILRTQQESSIDGILVVDEKGKILSFNQRFVDMWGVPPDAIESRSDERVLQSVMDKLESPEEFICKVEHLYEVREEICRDDIVLKEGRSFDRYSAPMFGADGKYYGRVWYFRDITDRKLAEEELKQTTEKLRKSLIGTIQALSSTVETRDPYTAGHQRRVSNLARTIAQEMGLPSDTVDAIRMAGIIHDIGKISVPAEILSKPGRISDIEMSLIKVHSQSGYDILKDAGLPYPVAGIVLQHHERLDGSGYPQGLKGDQILLEAQIISVADVVEAISSIRPYRPALGIDAALQEIEKNKGILHNEKVVEVCVRLFREKGFIFESTES
jgi:PAS domain S-box-containing protein/putative nucleotidyltransferase with HDIG domain